MNQRWTAIVMAAGAGTRMLSDTPKVVHALCGRPVVRHVIEVARAAGCGDVVVVVGPGDDAALVREAAGDGVRFAVQPQALGTGHAVECAFAEAASAGCVLILNGDVPLVLPETLERLMLTVDDTAVDLAILTADVPLESYGYLRLREHDRIEAIVETKGNEGLTPAERSEPHPINAGQYAVRAPWLWAHLARITPATNGERYLTALASMANDEGNPGVAVHAGDPDEVRGINDRAQLAEAEASMRARINRRHMVEGGVTIIDPAATYIDAGVTIGRDTVIEPQTYIRGRTSIGTRCVIGPGTSIADSTLGDNCAVRSSTVESSTLEDGVDMGPYSHLRPGTHLCAGVHIGNYAEVKASHLGPGTKMGHFSYIGDADVGEGVNIGAGTITANYDGAKKHRTTIGDGAFIGSDTMLVAPVNIGRGARTAAGSVVNRDVPEGMVAIGAPARIRSISAADTQEETEAGH
jgi:bifunctional UDP-N-acetylglucosamine pyrophosphorylase/glucosamine-1-phosphate N-acetyltransferase